ncbi:MAG: DNA translocase FtsK [Candidatus Amulumruptor caecigallinarius]|nr:DNA translocase FtsK [Candidatus Amulumruptor caecigallinarius]MCM1396319.1 DNA translocase FtsK [Candidatus Amulumruptor caecigallinarius]MCM1453739.1 DNA translocase FtsK [bacterium]
MPIRYNASTADFDPLSDVDLPTYDGDGEAIFTDIPQAEPEEPAAPEPAPQPQRAPRQRTARRRLTEEQMPASNAAHSNGRRGVLRRLFADGRASMFCGIVLIMFALYLIVAIISYLGNNAADQSAVDSRSLSELAAESGSVANTTGPLGAIISNSLVSRSLGIAALVVVFYCCALALSLLKVMKMHFWRLTSKCLLTAIAVSIIVGLLTYDFTGSVYWGGTHGHYINQLLLAYSGLTGAICISVVMAALVLLLFLPDLQKVWAKVDALLEKRRERLRRQREAAEAARAEREAAEREAANAAEASERTAEDAVTPAFAPAEPSWQPVDTDIVDESTRGATPLEQPVEIAPLADIAPEEPYNPSDPICDTGGGEVDEDPVEPEFTVEVAPEIKEAHHILEEPYDPTADLPHFMLPSLDCMIDRPVKTNSVDQVEQDENKERIIKTLGDYGIAIQSINATVGPTVTLYEIVPAEGVRIAKIKRLEDDIALSLAAMGIRIIAPIPGRGTIGIEVPNKDPQIVSMRSIITSEAFQNCHMELPMAVGATIAGEVFIADLCKMPHLLVAGATGMGKSVGLNAIIASILYKKHPAEVKFVMIDPKMVEFSLYSRLERHYLAKLPDEEDAIITDPAKAVTTLKSLCVEMDQRYELLKDANLRNIKEYNARFVERRLNPERGHRFLPYIVVIVDEFADLIMTAGKEVETPIARIAQKARAVGIHIILATQRPSTNVITGIIKANFPGRVAFRVTQMVDSRTIIDRPGANQLIGRGDMLFSRDGEITRVQCAFIDTPEVDAICQEITEQVGYEHAYYLPEALPDEVESVATAGFGDRDPLFDDAARYVVGSNIGSTSGIQRHFSIGYNRAGKIMDQMEAAGIVGPSQGGKPRPVLMDIVTLETLLAC